MFTSICIALSGVGIDFSGHFPVVGVGSWLFGAKFCLDNQSWFLVVWSWLLFHDEVETQLTGPIVRS